MMDFYDAVARALDTADQMKGALFHERVSVIERAILASVKLIADRLEELERQRAEMTEKTIVGEYMWSPAELHVAIICARREALEEAAKIADDWLSYDPSEKTKFHSIAAAIRALSNSTPTPLQEQKANSGKEGKP